MKQFSFEATGTLWTILVDQEFELSVFEAIRECAEEFEMKFSRFKETSEIGRINSAVVTPLKNGIHLEAKNNQNSSTNNQIITNYQSSMIKELAVSDELAEMLVFGKELQKISDGYFDVNVASVLEGHGYDREYSFRRNEELLKRVRGEWSVERSKVKGQRSKLNANGLVRLDLGSFGKGRLIDLIADLLRGRGISYFLVDGGRDFYGTSKADGSAWMIGLEHPFDAMLAIGEFPLKNCALACSGISQRKVKDFHHFMDTKTNKPVAEPVGVFVSAESAMVADGVSTAMVVSPVDYVSPLHEEYDISYCVVYRSGEIIETGFSNYLYA